MRQKAKLALLLGLLVVLVVVLTRVSSTPQAAGTPAPGGGVQLVGPTKRLVIPNAHIDAERLSQVAPIDPATFKRNIFEYRVAAPPPPDPIQAVDPTPPPPPPPPPAPVRFYGFAESRGGLARRVFLTDGEEIFVVSEGEVFLRRYRVTRVAAQSVEVEDLNSQHRWVVPLEQP